MGNEFKISHAEFKEIYVKNLESNTGHDMDYWNKFFRDSKDMIWKYSEPASDENDCMCFTTSREEVRMYFMSEQAIDRFYGDYYSTPGVSDPSPIVRGAEKFAIAAHGDQKYGDQFYAFYLRNVVRVLHEENYAERHLSLLLSAWLHDVVEDTGVKIKRIKSKFGEQVADIVQRVTDEPGSTRKIRKEKTYRKIKGHFGATIVKLCDRIANVEAAGDHPEKFEMYKSEHESFKEGVFITGIGMPLWDRLAKSFVSKE